MSLAADYRQTTESEPGNRKLRHWPKLEAIDTIYGDNVNHRQSDIHDALTDRFSPYQAYKQSDIDWIGRIPAHWKVARLKSFATTRLSNVDKKSTEGQEFVQLCNYVDVYYNEQIDDSIDFMSATATSDQVRRFALQSGDVLITKDSETWTDIAVPAVVSEDLPGVLCGYHLAHIRPLGHCYGGFLSRLFAAIGPRDQFHISANGITRFGLTGDSVRSAVFALPPLPEQRAIAAFLDRETARIDALVEKKERLIELLQEKRDGLIAHAVTRGLDPNVPTKDSGVEWLGEIPAHWEVRPSRRDFEIQLGKMLQPTSNGPDDSEIPYFKAVHVQWEAVQTTGLPLMWARLDDELKYGVRDGDLLVCEGGEVGRAGIVYNPPEPAIIQNALHRVRSFGTSDVRLLMYLLQHIASRGWFDILCNRATIAHFTSEKFGDLPIPLPPLPEQRAIAAFLDQKTTKIDALVAKVRQAIDRLKELRSALISATVTGKIDVRNEFADSTP